MNKKSIENRILGIQTSLVNQQYRKIKKTKGLKKVQKKKGGKAGMVLKMSRWLEKQKICMDSRAANLIASHQKRLGKLGTSLLNEKSGS
jgi:hypothetical protein